MTPPRRVVIDHGPQAAARYADGWAVVGVDVFRAGTVICTAVASGRRCLVARDLEDAVRLGEELGQAALLAGEQGGRVPAPLELGNSPSALSRRTDVGRPLVLVTSSGTLLLRHADKAAAVFAASLRNVAAQVRHCAGLGLHVAVIAAGTRGDRRREDDLVSARIAAGLMAAGFRADPPTEELVRDMSGRAVAWIASGRSAQFLRETGAQDDIDFVLEHVNDLSLVCQVEGHEAFARWVGNGA